MAGETRSFHIGDLITVVDHHLVSPTGIDGVYNVCDFVTGEAHMTHQLPRAAREVTPWLLEQHPWLAGITVPDGLGSQAAVEKWMAPVIAEYGEWHAVRPLPPGSYVMRGPLAEIREMAPQAQIIVVQID